MSIHLEDYSDLLEDLGDHAAQVLESAWHEATRAFSPAGLERYYLEGARSLHSLGRGTELVVAFIQEAPGLAHELGEDAVAELLSSSIRMYSKTSSAVITLVISTAPIAARRLGDHSLFEGYLRLLDSLLGQAPRGVRPMLEHLDELLSHLTLGGLRRWATWGAQAHRSDLEAQIEYFGLQSPESRSVFQKERRGTLFVDVQRRINLYLRSLWGRDFFMRPTSGDFESREGYRPYIQGFTLFLPDAFDDTDELTGLDLYRAAAAHAAAHMVHTRERQEEEAPRGIRGALLELFEDARVEGLTLAAFPGLGQIWKPLHTATPEDGDAPQPLLARTARALIDADYTDPHPFVDEARAAFARESDLERAGLAAELAEALAPAFPEKGYVNPKQIAPEVVYRDDNRYIWAVGREDEEEAEVLAAHGSGQERIYVTPMEMINTLDVPSAGDDAQQIMVLATEFFRDGEDTSINAQEGKEPISLPFHYHEWDYQMQLERPHWVTLLERRPEKGDLDEIYAINEKHKPLIARLKYLIEAIQPQGVQRLRRQPEGDELDVNALVEAQIDLRMNRQPDERIYTRTLRQERDLSVLVLLDLSESTNETVRGTDTSVVQLAREATTLLSGAISRIGDPFAIHGFNSDGRHDVEYFRFKDFDAPWDDTARARLAGMKGALSTRMGAAIRHATEQLRARGSQKKLMLVITDGEPSDTDVRDPQYLRFDARRAVEEAGRNGVHSFCMSLDPNADDYVERIFGNHYMVLDRVERLPEKLPMLYAGLTTR
ncbi:MULTISPECIES: nitric oxide reductase activation protein NorD [unclassified Thioalkalivibrio]|uniref:nitric oxide reductase activation protein NorD n=1 Tax=unclassified Thioalkalivibrio TaxID=2621013 RepID=UPI00036120DA|nr:MULTISPECIES: nitric oxide reductase activation protein NorD [unclassified Thioalkalivibrio]PYG02707.1 Nitric oxide reductase activation protein [Thioalkalivibrio sp. ALE21]